MFKSDLDILKGIILFAKQEKIANFRYKDFEFNLTAENPNADELKALREDLEYTKNLIQKIKAGAELRR